MDAQILQTADAERLISSGEYVKIVKNPFTCTEEEYIEAARRHAVRLNKPITYRIDPSLSAFIDR